MAFSCSFVCRSADLDALEHGGDAHAAADAQRAQAVAPAGAFELVDDRARIIPPVAPSGGPSRSRRR
jgi:hypothetical protein